MVIFRIRCFSRSLYPHAVKLKKKYHSKMSNSSETELYTVLAFTPSDTFGVAALKEIVRYPPTKVPDVVNTEIGLWAVKTEAKSIFSWRYWKSFFYPIPEFDYKIVLRQAESPKGNGSEIAILLHETIDEEASFAAFKKLKNTIEPLVDDCTLMLTADLLKEIILPEPMDPSNLSHHLTEVMETNPTAHPDWVKVMRTLVLSAIDRDNDKDVEDVFENEAVIGAADSKGDTILHRAASKGSAKVWKHVTSKLMLKRQNPKRLLSVTNQSGENPVQIAFHKNLAEIVTAMMNTGLHLSDCCDDKGCNPFHLAAEANSQESIEAAVKGRRSSLISSACDNDDVLNALNSVNNDGFTPLMVAVRKGYIGSAASLILAGVEIDKQHSITGDTALHIAAKLGLTPSIKMLIAFRADLFIKNKEGKTALEEARESNEEDSSGCVQALEETTQLIEAANAELAKPKEIAPVDPESLVALCLDGGGNRSIVACQVLIALYERMKQIRPDCKPLYKYFDYLSGTSAGGLEVLTLLYLQLSPKYSLTYFFRVASGLLSKTPNCPQEIVDSGMQDMFGSDTLMSDIQVPRVIIAVCRADENPPELELICNYRNNGDKEWKVWEAIRASTAAPTYFPPHEGKYIDGGMVANNPTLDTMVEIFKQGERENKQVKIGMILSLGSGVMPKEKIDDIDIFLPESSNILTSILKASSTVQGLVNIFSIMMNQSTRADGTQVQQAHTWCQTLGAEYFRFSIPLSENVDLAVRDKEKLIELMYITLHYTLRNAKQLDTVARLLLSRD